MTHLQETARNAHSELDADIVFRSLAKFKTEVDEKPNTVKPRYCIPASDIIPLIQILLTRSVFVVIHMLAIETTLI